MSKYMIHAVPQRMWYVKEYLIPSMIDQGIAEDDIIVYVDKKKEGNLKSFIKSFKQAGKLENEGTWHLQDDVIISHNFKTVTESIDFGIVCGFKSGYDKDTPAGPRPIQEMWFSFPCIRVPTKIARECAEWVEKFMIGNQVYKEYWKDGVNDDWFFRRYVWDYYKNDYIINLNPNLVDHIDYLIGGTVNSSKRGKQMRSVLWEDNYLVEELGKKLKEREQNESIL